MPSPILPLAPPPAPCRAGPACQAIAVWEALVLFPSAAPAEGVEEQERELFGDDGAGTKTFATTTAFNKLKIKRCTQSQLFFKVGYKPCGL